MTTPPANLSVIEKLKSSYKIWYDIQPHIPKTARYTLGGKIDSLFISTLEHTARAAYSPRERKSLHLGNAIISLDLLKFFLQLTWEIGVLENKHYTQISEVLNEGGRMLGGWFRQYTKNQPNS